MVTTPKYDADVQRNLDKLRGNVSSKKMTPQECREEILKVTEGVIDTDREARLALAKVGINALIDEVTDYQQERPKDDLKKMLAREREEGNKGEIKEIYPEVFGTPGSNAYNPQVPPNIGYVTKSGRHYKAKPGRKPKTELSLWHTQREGR